MVVTSVAIPPLASWHWLTGRVNHRGAAPWRDSIPDPAAAHVAAVLFDRDGTLIEDVPYNGDPTRVRPRPGVADALARLRGAGVRTGVVTNQSGVARGLLSPDQVSAVNERVDALLGPFDTWQVCPHDDADGCTCRKPRPGMVQAASDALGVPARRCVVVGDTGADVSAAHAAGAVGILVPNDATLPSEIEGAPRVYDTVPDAVAALLEAVGATA